MKRRSSKGMLAAVAGSGLALALGVGAFHLAGGIPSGEVPSLMSGEGAQGAARRELVVERQAATASGSDEAAATAGGEGASSGVPAAVAEQAPAQEYASATGDVPEEEVAEPAFVMPEDADYVPEVALIQVDPAASPDEVAGVLSAAGGVVDREVSPEEIETGLIEVELKQGVEVEDAVNELLACGSDAVEGAQPNYVYYALGVGTAQDLRAYTEPTLLSQQEVRELRAASDEHALAAAQDAGEAAVTPEGEAAAQGSSTAQAPSTGVASDSSAQEAAAGADGSTDGDGSKQGEGSASQSGAEAAAKADEPGEEAAATASEAGSAAASEADAANPASSENAEGGDADSVAGSDEAQAKPDEDAQQKPDEEAQQKAGDEASTDQEGLSDLLAEGVSVNDPSAKTAWQLASIHAYDAWALAKANHTVTVAVLDGGVDTNHADLKANILSNYAYNAHTGNRGTSAVQPDSGLYNHATHVAGIIGATANNGVGVAGVSYNAYVLPIKVFNGSTATTKAVADAYDYLMKQVPSSYNVHVVNLSVGAKKTGSLSGYDAAVIERIQDAYTNRNIVTVCAAGNSSLGTVPYDIYPGDYSPVVSVINLAEEGSGVKRSTSSNYNVSTTRRKNISAPGDKIYSTIPSSSYGSMSGTSMAAPCVAGVLALEFSVNKNLTGAQAVGVLYNTAADLGSSGWDREYGYGEVNAYRAVSAVVDGRLTTEGAGAVTINIKNATITLSPSSATYTGSAITPAVSVTYGGRTLINGVDYTVSYANNVRVGTGTVTIAGKGNFSGSIAKGFSITKAAPSWQRLWGDTALDTMQTIVSSGGFPAGRTVVLVTDQKFQDALTAASLAGMAGAPIVMTNPSELSSQARSCLSSLRPQTIVVCGGTLAISDSVAAAASSAAGGASVVRCWGETAIDTANEIFTRAASITGGSWGSVGFVCTSQNYRDALSAAPISYAKHYPIFLTDRDSIRSSTISAMKRGGITKVYVLGGTIAIADDVISTLRANGITVLDRIWGETAIDTSAKVAEFGVSQGLGANGMGVATNNGFKDALAAAAFCGKRNSVIVLVDGPDSNSLSSFVRAHRAEIAKGFVFGGTIAIDDSTYSAIVSASR